MKKSKLILIVTTAVLFVSFIITLFNPFADDDTKKYAVKNYYEITFTEGEDRYDEDYFAIYIKNISNSDVYNNEFVFGIRGSDISADNFIWFRIAKIDAKDTIKILIYEDKGIFTVSGKNRTYDASTYVLALEPVLPNLDLDRCMSIDVANIDSETPEVYRIDAKFWSLDKVITLSGTVISSIGLLVVMFFHKHIDEEKLIDELKK